MTMQISPRPVPAARALAVAAWIVIVPLMHAASFDCSKAHRGHEALICANQELSKADDALADVYRRAHGALASVGPQKEAKRAQQRLEKEQKEWMKTRQSKCPDVDCLQREYQLRLATLRSYLPDEAGAARPIPTNPPVAEASLPPSASSHQVPENQQPPSSPQQPVPQSAPLVRPELPQEEPVAASGDQPIAASNIVAAEGKSPGSVPVSPSDKPLTDAGKPESGTVEESSPGVLATISSAVSNTFSGILWIFVFLYVMWGAYWGCQIVYPRMLEWYNSSTWLIFGTGPMDILKRQIIFGLQVRFWAIVIGTVVGCLGGAVYMQFFRVHSPARA